MAHITANYKMYLPAGHHRQPRNANAELSLAPSSGGDTPYSPPYFPQLPYTLPNSGGDGIAKLLFWSDTDGTTGVVRPPVAFDIPSSANARTVTGWYFPISGPGVINGGSAIIDDAFSANLGTFIDDTFVDVISDPSLTADANVIGVVPTASAQTLVAKGHVLSVPEPFSQWVLNDSIMPVGNSTLQVPAGTDGIAIAIYQQGNFPKPPNLGRDFAEAVRIIFGVIQDGGGLTDHGPVGPWDPLITQLLNASQIASHATKVRGTLSAEITALAAQDTLAVIRAAVPQLEKLAGKQK